MIVAVTKDIADPVRIGRWKYRKTTNRNLDRETNRAHSIGWNVNCSRD